MLDTAPQERENSLLRLRFDKPNPYRDLPTDHAAHGTPRLPDEMPLICCGFGDDDSKCNGVQANRQEPHPAHW
jgi:hypothetical protein